MPPSALPPRDLDGDAALRSILEGTAAETGEGFFAALVQHLSNALGVHSAWVTQWFPERRRLRTLAFWKGDRFAPDYEYDVGGTPCEAVMQQDRLVQLPQDVMDLFPDDPDLGPMGAVSYMGAPLKDADGTIMGHLAVQDTRPLSEHDERVRAVFRIFAARAAAELRRLRAEAQVREREEKLGLLVDSAMDAIVELDHACRVLRMNAAALKVFGCVPEQAAGHDLGRFLLSESRDRLEELCQELAARVEGERYLWIPGGLTAVRAGGEEFPAEATLSRYELRGEAFFTLILRNVNERLEAEREIAYLRDEIRELQGFDEIVGQSAALERVLRQVRQVAGTDSTVLIQGETGTGKELIARAIHAAGNRSERPFVTVNCAAIPATLIESELFGHEKGAFTGATQKRDGRFALAEGGTLFLDEIGELSPDLQSKLLRVLQEGEFEPVGSSQTRTVDVRVVAATNRDLPQAVADGGFREDLFYRLNVFPITLPPLRERPDDIPLLAERFARRFAQRMGRGVEPLSAAAVRRLQAYHWPGNVRELENVMERAVITAEGGRLDITRALPEAELGRAAPGPRAAASEPGGAAAPTPASPERGVPVRTVDEMRQLERANLMRALEAAGWKVAGQSGAAQLLGMRPSTLTSRMKALGIERPRSEGAAGS